MQILVANEKSDSNDNSNTNSNSNSMKAGTKEEESISSSSFGHETADEDLAGDSKHSSGHLSNLSGSGGQDDTENSRDAIRAQLTKQESRNVFRIQVLVILVLVAAAISISVLVYTLVKEGELHEFETQYEGAASKVIESFESIMKKMGSVGALGVSFTSYGDDHQGEIRWPFVTLNNFEQKASQARHLSGALMVGMSPVVTEETFYYWDNYVLQPQYNNWIEESIAYQERLGMNNFESQAVISKQTMTSMTNRTVEPMHYHDQEGNIVIEEAGEHLYFPMWQTSPYLREGVLNENLLGGESADNAKDILLHVWDSATAVVGGYVFSTPGTTESSNPLTALLSALLSVQEGKEVPYLGDPVANVYMPIFDTFDESKRKVVGVLTSLIHWQDHFRNVLPDSIHGVVVVLDYECGAGGFIHDHAEEGEEFHEGHDHRQRRRDLASSTVVDPDVNGTDQSASSSSSGNHSSANDNQGGDDHSATLEEDQDHDEHGQEEEDNDHDEYGQEEEDNIHDEHGHEDEDNDHDDHSGEEEDDHSGHDSELSTSGHNVDNHGEDDHSDHDEHDDDPTKEEEVHGTRFTYILDGSEVHALGYGDLHDTKFDSWRKEGDFSKASKLEDGTVLGIKVDERCAYHLHVYPSQAFYEEFNTKTPIVITTIIVAMFTFAILIFIFYNHLVERRQQVILNKATQSAAIVSSLFPKNVRDRLMKEEELGLKKTAGNKARIKGFIAGESDDNENDGIEAPIADLFPHCTVYFGDIAGFTAWSSTREPSQVFILLQTLYQAMDSIAKRRNVFKVETIGDCYMAVTGLPDPQVHHASIMVRFAWDCLAKMNQITKKLESTLGPDTTELSLRIGLHSGPVTGGVLRGDRARFQLFGDTVNTASRMESTGTRGTIHVSETTANLLRDAGKEHWITLRKDSVTAKGKGVLRTYFVNPTKSHTSSSGGSSASPLDVAEKVEPAGTRGTTLEQAQLRLVDWIVRLMVDDIKKIVCARKKTNILVDSKTSPSFIPPEGVTCMDEVKEVIHMPKFDEKKGHHQTGDYKMIELDNDFIQLLGEYVAAIASKYRNNPFHNFEHACHVTMSVNKLLRRIVSPELSEEQIEKIKNTNQTKLAMHLHDYTYGINSDPLAMFAMTFSALIHDVDHRGVSNMQLVEEAPEMAEKYHKKSIAEQNSLDLAWDILMEERFAKLRSFLFVSDVELMRFRQLIVNVVLATDIFDKELNDLRKNRWKRAFSGELLEDETQQNDLRATIVIEHIIQASDVSHTMQHWHVYQKWNKCLFKEMYAAYKTGRLAKDPATFWYKGEIGFFDNYIIPLAKKLKDCGVFGVSSDEYLNYAVQNRAEWAERGEQIVEQLLEEVKRTGTDAGTAAQPSTAQTA